MSTKQRSLPGKRVLLSEGSSLSARQTLYALGGHHTVDVLDPDPICQGRFSRFVHRFHRCPAYGKDPLGYLEALRKLVRGGDYDVLVPTHEQVYLLAKYRDELRQYVGMALPSFEQLDELQSKVRFSRLLDQLGLPQPPCRILTTAQELLEAEQLPCFVKQPYSTAGQGVEPVEDREQMQLLIDRWSDQGAWSEGRELLLQAPGIGVQATAQGVFQHGRLVGFHCFEARALGVGGMSMARVSATHRDVQSHLQTLGQHLDWHGAVFLDYFYDADQGPQYIEANPRIGETVNATLSGVNLCEQLIRVSAGEPVEPLPLGRTGVRSHSGFMILMAAAKEGATRRDLIRESWACLTNKGLYRSSEDELTRPRQDWLSLLPATATTLQLLVHPGRAKRLVNKAVENYSLPDAMVRKIQSLQPPTPS